MSNINRRRPVAAIEGDGFYPDGYTAAAIDALLEAVDRELQADEAAAEAAYRYDFNDQPRAARSLRRSVREELRALPGLLATSHVDNQAA